MAIALYNDYYMDSTAEQRPVKTPTQEASHFVTRHFNKIAGSLFAGTEIASGALIAFGDTPSRVTGIATGIASALAYTKLLRDHNRQTRV